MYLSYSFSEKPRSRCSDVKKKSKSSIINNAAGSQFHICDSNDITHYLRFWALTNKPKLYQY